MRHDPPAKLKRSLFTRRRFQYAGALVLGALLPVALRGTVLPGIPGEAASVNALFGNLVGDHHRLLDAAVDRDLPRHPLDLCDLPDRADRARPGRRRLPADAAALRPPRAWRSASRPMCCGAISSISMPSAGSAGGSRSCRSERSSGWTQSTRSTGIGSRGRGSRTRAGCHAIVADFAADLPDEWEAFLADAALAGRIVYQVKQLSESLTGRVELDASFGEQLRLAAPGARLFLLEVAGRFPVRACCCCRWRCR